MTSFEVYRLYLALSAHYRDVGYDYFKFNGNIKTSEEAFKRRKDKTYFSRISKLYNPETYLIGNFIFSKDNKLWIGKFKQDYQREYEQCFQNGFYTFKEDIKKLKRDFNSNFLVDNMHSIPYIIDLYKKEEISFYTCCVFETILNCDRKWRSKEQYVIFDDISQKIVKSAPFFNIKPSKYKAALLNEFKQ